jgi:hypothetical protein
MSKIGENIGAGLVLVAMPFLNILGVVIHIYTIVTAFTFSGLFGAIITLFVPVIGQIYWFFSIWSAIGLDNLFCITILSYIGLWIIVLIGFAIMKKNNSELE